MSLSVFNTCLLTGWAMATAGCAWWWPPAGLMVGGATLVALTLLVSRMGGVVR